MALKRFVCTSLLSAGLSTRSPIPVMKETTALVSILFQSPPRMCFSTDSKTTPIPKNEDNSCAGLERKNHVISEKVRQGIVKATMKYFKLLEEEEEEEEEEDRTKIKFNHVGLHISVPTAGFKREDLTIEVKDEFLFVKGEINDTLCIDEAVILPSYHTFNPREVAAAVVDDQLIVTFPYGDQQLIKAAFTI